VKKLIVGPSDTIRGEISSEVRRICDLHGLQPASYKDFWREGNSSSSSAGGSENPGGDAATVGNDSVSGEGSKKKKKIRFVTVKG
jgi:hypothetical protein